MKSGKYLGLLAGLAVLLLAASLLYPRLKERYEADLPAVSEAAAAEAPALQVSPEETAAPAPDFTVYDGEHEPVSLSELTGKPVLINFWATWCGYCVQELPAFEAASREYGDRIHFMMIDLADGHRETVEGAKNYAAEMGYTFPVYYDTELSAAAAYNVSSIPMTLLIGADGQLKDQVIGAMSEEALSSYISQLLEE